MTIVINFVKLPEDGEKQNKNAKTDPITWRAVQMMNPNTKFKVVDDNEPPINVAHMFNSLATAQQYIDHHLWIKNNPCPEGQVHNLETGECIVIPRNIDPKTKNLLAPFEGQNPRYNWRTGNQFTRGYDSKCEDDGKTGPTIEFELEGQPANGEVVGHVWLPDGVFQCRPDVDDEITLILKDNHGDGANNEFQYKIRIPYNNDDGNALLMKEYEHHKYQDVENVNYQFRPVAKGNCTIGMKAVWHDTPNGVMIKFYVDEGEPVLDQNGNPRKNSKGENMMDSWRPNAGIHESHMNEEWGEDEDLPDSFYQGNPTNNWRLVFEHEDTQKDEGGNPPYKGVTGVQTAFRIDARGKFSTNDITHKNRPVLYGGLVREITPPS